NFHSIMRILILLLVVVFTFTQCADLNLKEIYQNPLSNGYGEDINWVKWDDAIEKALDEDKPIFLLIHKTWCHACRALKKTFSQSNARKAFKALSEYFIMVNTADDDEPYEEEYRPDGKYIPRLLFLDKNGDLLTQFKNKKGEFKNYAYYYSSPADILNSMKEVLKHYEVEVTELKRGDKLKKKAAEKKETKKEEKKEKKSEL
ncbi:txdc-12.1, partial [Pristionchus pacificus]